MMVRAINNMMPLVDSIDTLGRSHQECGFLGPPDATMHSAIETLSVAVFAPGSYLHGSVPRLCDDQTRPNLRSAAWLHSIFGKTTNHVNPVPNSL